MRFCITHKVIVKKRKVIKAEIDEEKAKELVYCIFCKIKEEGKTFLMGRYITISLIAKDYHLA